MKFALMQPYFLPYIGYWQLMREVDVFVISNDTKYIKQSWINRNRLLFNGQIRYITLPLRSASDYALISDRKISSDFDGNRETQKICQSYGIKETDHRKEFVSRVMTTNGEDLDRVLLQSINLLSAYLKINCQIVLASDLEIPGILRKEERIYFVGKTIGGHDYYNLPGGRDLYNKTDFHEKGYGLNFIDPVVIPYKQKVNNFVPNLSILDLILSEVNEQDIALRLASYTVD